MAFISILQDGSTVPGGRTEEHEEGAQGPSSSLLRKGPDFLNALKTDGVPAPPHRQRPRVPAARRQPRTQPLQPQPTPRWTRCCTLRGWAPLTPAPGRRPPPPPPPPSPTTTRDPEAPALLQWAMGTWGPAHAEGSRGPRGPGQGRREERALRSPSSRHPPRAQASASGLATSTPPPRGGFWELRFPFFSRWFALLRRVRSWWRRRSR